MKEILVLAEGILAKHFISRLASSKINLYHYSLVCSDERIKKLELGRNFSLFSFDPTSESKLRSIIDGKSFAQAFIVMSNKKDSYACYENLRKFSLELEISLLSMWSLSEYKQTISEDKRLDVIDGKNTMTTRLIDSLPDMPVFADNIGLGEGEIMEVKVPAHSPYAYRNIGSIQQRKWRIALILRANTFILPSSAEQIKPGDSLIAVGDPNVLENVFRAIKREQAQFPNPFGANIYCLIDMKILNDDEIATLIDSCLFLHYKLASRKLFFKVINPSLNKSFNILKELDEPNVDVMIEYDKSSLAQIQGDMANLDVGLVVANDRQFFKFKKYYYELRLPILKLGKTELNRIKSGIILSSSDIDLQSQSAVIMDICAQLGVGLELFYFNAQNDNTAEMIYYFDGISRLFEQNIKINVHKGTNPLLNLSKQDNLLQFVLFESELAGRNLFAILSNKINRLFKRLRQNSQLFIPTTD